MQTRLTDCWTHENSPGCTWGGQAGVELACTANDHSQQKVISYPLSADMLELKYILHLFQSNNPRLHKISSGWGIETVHTED